MTKAVWLFCISEYTGQQLVACLCLKLIVSIFFMVGTVGLQQKKVHHLKPIFVHSSLGE